MQLVFMALLCLTASARMHIRYVPRLSLQRSAYLATQVSIPKTPSTNSTSSAIIPMKLSTTSDEEYLFNLIADVIHTNKLRTVARVAGGWVRDKLMHRANQHDIDIVLDNMSGASFTKLMNEYRKKNKQRAFRFAVIAKNPEKSKHLETATMQVGPLSVDFVNMRIEEYNNVSRIPTIKYGTPTEDAHRRDFTVNALFYNLSNHVVEDYTERGINDMQNKIIATPRNALETFLDDPLRVFRAVRLATQLDFSISKEVLNCAVMSEVQENILKKVSRERIAHEIALILSHSSAARGVVLLHELGLLSVLMNLPLVKDPSSEPSPAYRQRGVAVFLALEAICRRLDNLSYYKTIVGDGAVEENVKVLRAAALASALRNITYMQPQSSKKNSNLGASIVKNLVLKNRYEQTALNLYMSMTNKPSLSALLLHHINLYDAHDSLPTPDYRREGEHKYYGEIDRMNLAEALYQAGELWNQSLLLFAAETLVERLANRISDKYQQCDEGMLYGDIIGVLSHVLQLNTTKSFDVSLQALVPHVLHEVVASAKSIAVIHDAIDALHLHNVWNKPRVISGEAINKIFSKIPPGPAFKQILLEQFKFSLQYPEATEDEIASHLKLIFCDYI